MEIEKYIQLHYNKLQELAKKITHNHQNSDDLLNDCIMDLLSKGSDYCQNLMVDGKVSHYVAKMIKIQYNSSTSPFYFMYRNPNKTQSLEEPQYNVGEDTEEQIDIDKMANDVRVYIGNLNIYERTVAHKHFEEGVSQREMSKTYNINRLHISKTLKSVQSNIQMQFKKEKYKK